mmetsp:Transcript_19146/g.21330  ORF Transcript_19146/g.21330 Transcript_19146/m.21330 type:complete len:91 (-) Transcript_19146:1176-1448(-)
MKSPVIVIESLTIISILFRTSPVIVHELTLALHFKQASDEHSVELLFTFGDIVGVFALDKKYVGAVVDCVGSGGRVGCIVDCMVGVAVGT